MNAIQSDIEQLFANLRRSTAAYGAAREADKKARTSDTIAELIGAAKGMELDANQLRVCWAYFMMEAEKDRARLQESLVEACAMIAESYEPHCESCPRGVANAIRTLKLVPR